MPYIINNYNGQQLTIVNDGTLDQTTDIKLVGKNYAGFGEVFNENFIHLLESFSGASQPPNPLAGQLWYDSANRVIKFYDGNRFRIAGGAEIGANAPTGLAIGDLWWETDGEQLYVYNGTDFILVGPIATGGEGVSQLVASTVKDVSGNDRTLLKVTIEDQVLSVVSKDEFTLDSTLNPIPGFSAIKKGFNLASNATIPGIRYWGSADNADNLGGIPAAQYVLNSGLQSFSDQVKFLDDLGITIGAGEDLRLWVTSGDQANIENQVGSILRFNVNTGSGVINVGKFDGVNFVPASDGTGSLGTVVNKWGNVYADSFIVDDGGTFSGNLTGNVTGNITGNVTGDLTGNVTASSGTSTFNNLTVSGTLTANVSGTSAVASKLVVDSGTAREASTLLENNKIVARDSSGNINVNIVNGTATNSQALSGASPETGAVAGSIAQRDANKDLTARKFLGTATAAQFADLAEIYSTKEEYSVGTVVSVCECEDHEMEPAEQASYAIGIISENPAYLMNSEADGQAVALKGRVPVRVVGSVKKGQKLYVLDSGVCTANAVSNQPVAVALESNDDIYEKLVECVIIL